VGWRSGRPGRPDGRSYGRPGRRMQERVEILCWKASRPREPCEKARNEAGSIVRDSALGAQQAAALAPQRFLPGCAFHTSPRQTFGRGQGARRAVWRTRKIRTSSRSGRIFVKYNVRVTAHAHYAHAVLVRGSSPWTDTDPATRPGISIRSATAGASSRVILFNVGEYLFGAA
jgi:hypothetical protein